MWSGPRCLPDITSCYWDPRWFNSSHLGILVSPPIHQACSWWRLLDLPFFLPGILSPKNLYLLSLKAVHTHPHATLPLSFLHFTFLHITSLHWCIMGGKFEKQETKLLLKCCLLIKKLSTSSFICLLIACVSPIDDNLHESGCVCVRVHTYFFHHYTPSAWNCAWDVVGVQ